MRQIITALAAGTLLASAAHAAPPKGGKSIARPKTVERGKTGKTVKASKAVKRGKTRKAVARPKDDAAMTPAQRLAWRTALNAARAAQKAGDLPEAIRQFDAALAAYPDDARALGERGWARYKQNDFKAAEADLMSALARGGDPLLRGSQLYNLGRVHEAAGRMDAAIAAYRASLAARPHIAVRQRLEALTKAPVTPLGVQAAAPIADLATVCAAAGAEQGDGETPECTLGEVAATLGQATVRPYVVRTSMGEETTHLVFDLPGEKRYLVQGAHYEYNPGAFGISEETEYLKLSAAGDTLLVHARKQRHDSDMGINEVEFETTETRMYCGIAQGVPQCSQAITTLYDGARELLEPDQKDDTTEHDLWARKWALALTLEGKLLKVGNAGGALPKGPAALVGNHPLPW